VPTQISQEFRNAKVWIFSIGVYSPFHFGQWNIFRKLSTYADQMIVNVAGLHESTQSPFSYDLRKKIIENSLGPLYYKTTIVPALAKKGGKIIQTGYIKSLLQKIEGYQYVDAIIIPVGQDRYLDFSTQLKEIQKDNKTFKKTRVINCGIMLNEYGSKISASSIRGALLADDVEYIKHYLAPNITKNPVLFKEIYGQMKKEIEDSYGAQRFDKLAKSTEKSNRQE
jgi:phosphopantetheine adenylyltransferase